MYEEGLIYFLNIAPNFSTGNEASLQECLKAGFVPVDKDNNILMNIPQTILDAYCYLYNINTRFFYNNYNEVQLMDVRRLVLKLMLGFQAMNLNRQKIIQINLE